MWMRTGTRWARRTQVKIGLTEARPEASGCAFGTLMPRESPWLAAQQGTISHELDRRGVASLDPAELRLLEIGVDPVRGPS